MKLSGYILITVIIGLAFASVGMFVNDLSSSYPDVEIDTSWETEYNYAQNINQSVSPLKEKFDTIENGDAGWFSKVSAGITAVPFATITVPKIIFETMSFSGTIISQLGVAIGVPTWILTIATMCLIIIILFALVSFWHRSRA